MLIVSVLSYFADFNQPENSIPVDLTAHPRQTVISSIIRDFVKHKKSSEVGPQPHPSEAAMGYKVCRDPEQVQTCFPT